MAHLLLVESWVGAMGTLLPRALTDLGVEFTFLTRRPEHYPQHAPDGSLHPLRRGRAVVTAETNELATALAAVRAIDAQFPIDGVLTSCDYYLPVVARVADELGLPGPAPSGVDVACNKALTRAALDRCEIPGARHVTVPVDDEGRLRAAAEFVGFPLVLKPTDLCAGMFVRRVDDWAALEAAARDLHRFDINARGQRREPVVLLEEFLDGPEFSVESWIRRGEIHSVGVTDKSLGGASGFVETGHMFPADVDELDRTQLVVAAEEAIRAVGLDCGVVHTELRLTVAGPRIIEINPRPAGNQITELVRHVTGVDLPRVAVELALGREPSLPSIESGPLSAAVAMLVPTKAGVLNGIDGADTIAADPAVISAAFKAPGHRTTMGVDNNSYLGSVIAISHEKFGARVVVENLLSTVFPVYEEEIAS